MKKTLILSAMFCYGFITAQIKTPQPSPTASITQKVGVSNISVEYSRPGAKEREIFGGLVSYEKMWRTGANKVTKITFDENCVFGGAKIKKGSYSLFTIPGKKEWTVVLNKNTELWGVGEYDKEKQVCSIVAKVIETKDFTESFTIDFGTFQSFSAIMSLKWANTKIGIKIESLAAKELEKQFVELLTKGPSANDYYNGAKFFVDNTSEYDMALEWINTAIEKKPDAFWMKFHKARILKKIGNNKQSISVAEEVISLAKEKKDDYGYIKRSEDLIKSIKSK